MNAAHKVKSAFTLIELLVVIAIISLLVSILIPSLSKARELSKRVVCTTNLRGMGTMLSLYSTEFQDAMPLAWERHWGQSTIPGLAGDGKGYTWQGLLYHTVGQDSSLDIYKCPSDIRDFIMEEENLYVQDPQVSSYGGLCLGYLIPHRKLFWSLPGSPTICSDIPNPAEKHLVWDAHAPHISWGGGTYDMLLADILNTDYYSTWQHIFRHSLDEDPYASGPNGMFVDGHVEIDVDYMNIKDEDTYLYAQ